MPMKIKFQEKKEIKQTRYNLIGLSRNPFHPDPDPPDAPKVFAEYRKVWNKISTKISLAKTRGYNQNLILFANYGRGKSHILKFLRSQINSGDIRGIAFFALVPQSLRFSDLYKGLITSVNKSLLMERLKLDKIKDLRGQLGEDIESALKCLFNQDKSPLAWRWLQGSSTYSDERTWISVKNKLERNDEDCLSAFLALVDALIKSDNNLVFVGIDEIETAKARSPSEARSTEKLLELFRRFVDEVKSNVFFILAATEEWQAVWNMFGPLVSRFPSYDIETLEPISKINEFRLFVLEYLESERVDQEAIWNKINEAHQDKKSFVSKEQLRDSGVPDEEIDELFEKRRSYKEYLLFPFTDDGIEKLFEITRGLPRNIVRSCHFLIEKSVEQVSDIGSVKAINRDFVLANKSEIEPLIT
jgi:hypothetical protein